MTKIIKAFKAILLIISKPVLLNRVLQDPDIWEDHVKSRYSMGEGLPVIDPVYLFGEEYMQKLSLFSFLDGGSLVTDVTLLRGLARDIKDCSYFEIGTWRGESAVNVAEVAKEVYSLNLSDDELRKLGVNNETIRQQEFFSKNVKNIIHLKSDSTSFDFSSLDKKFDLIFIDGSHHYEDVRQDTENVFKYLVHDNSIVVWHDYAETPEKVRFEVFSGILDGLNPEEHKFLYHPGHTKSAIYFRKELPGKKLSNPVNPEYFYSVDIKYHKLEKQ